MVLFITDACVHAHKHTSKHRNTHHAHKHTSKHRNTHHARTLACMHSQNTRTYYIHTRAHSQYTCTSAHTHTYMNDAGGCSLVQQHYVQDKVFIGMDSAPEAFKLLDRLSGPGVSNKIYRVTKMIHILMVCG